MNNLISNLDLNQKVTLKVKYLSYSDDCLEAFKTKGTLRECLAEVADSDNFYINGDEILDDDEPLSLEEILEKLDDADGAAFIINLSIRVGNAKYQTLIENDINDLADYDEW